MVVIRTDDLGEVLGGRLKASLVLSCAEDFSHQPDRRVMDALEGTGPLPWLPSCRSLADGARPSPGRDGTEWLPDKSRSKPGERRERREMVVGGKGRPTPGS